MRLKLLSPFAVLSLLAFSLAASPALPFVSPIFGDDMVLQREKKNPIWGWTQPGETVRVSIADKSAQAVAGKDGKWQAYINPPPAGGPYTLTVAGATTVVFHEVMVGDVWLCGGQSNMELPLSRTRDGADVISQANCPEIRLFKVRSHPAYEPAQIVQGIWKICSPQTVAEDGGFSAVAYFFARELQNQIHVPIGLIEDCLGGTPAEAWTSPATLKRLGDFDQQLAEMERLRLKGAPQYGNYIMHWYDEYDIGQKERWQEPGFDDATWKTIAMPGGFGGLGMADSPCVCWLRKEVTLPDPLPNGKATIHLGVIDRMDTTYINGRWVGASAWVENPRAYPIPDGVLHPGKNLIALRVFQSKPHGGLLSPPQSLDLTLGDGSKIPLAGDWKAAISVDARPPHPMPLGFENWPVIPSVLFQGMIEPVAPLALTGAIWYQGEANADRAVQYRKLLPAMIADWRAVFHQGDFPFYIVSLPKFMHHRDEPAESNWAELREAQDWTARTVPHSGLAVTIDTGDPDNIHPPDKQVVGERLALLALARHYGKKVIDSGPTFKAVQPLPGALKLLFDNTDGGLVAKGGKLAEFSVAGADRQWHWADARLEGNAVIVSSPDVPDPKAARYAWQSYPEATLANGAGLPAAPFRTDDWPLSTTGRK